MSSSLPVVSVPKRIQRQRTKGWRLPANTVIVSRPSPWGNPFTWEGDRAVWFALAVGERADEAGRRAMAVTMFRWWIAGARAEDFPISVTWPEPRVPGMPKSEVEFSDGTRRPIADLVAGLGLVIALKDPLVIPQRPDLAPLRGRDLACWCPLDAPCHADVLIELANEDGRQEG